MKEATPKLIVMSLLVLLIGCAPRYACKDMIPGAQCMSLSETYAQAVIGEKSIETAAKRDVDDPNKSKFMRSENTNVALIVESPSKRGRGKPFATNENKTEKGITKSIQGADGGMPILRPPRIARIWLAPWIDSNGDLYMESFIYTEIEGKKWVIGNDMPDGARENIERSYNPLK